MAPRVPATVGESARPSQTHPILTGFQHAPVHRPVVIVNGGFWWGYPYSYYYYGYPVHGYGQPFEKVGKQWGKDLKHGKVTTEQFVTFLRLDVVKASDAARSCFQVGFLKGYGKNGLPVFTQALSQAHETPPAPGAAARPTAEKPAGKSALTAPAYH